MKKVGIVCASDIELAPFLEKIKASNITEKAMLKFYEGEIDHISAVALYSGVCKVNAAIAAQLLIDLFNVDIVINAGVAGGMHKDVKLFDTVISDQLAYHDVADGILTRFHPWMETIYFNVDNELQDIAREYARTSRRPVLVGRIVTGEQFITDDGRERINDKYSPLAVDMESASVAHVCHVNRVPFMAVRTISDTAEHQGVNKFEENFGPASGIAAEVTVDLIKRFCKAE